MLLKKLRIPKISIIKNSGLDSNGETNLVMKPKKIPLSRIPFKCGRTCEFYKHCCQWNPSYIIRGIYLKSGQLICNCDDRKRKFSYIFTYDTVRFSVPLELLKAMGIWEEPKLPKPELKKFSYTPPKNFYSKNYKIRGK